MPMTSGKTQNALLKFVRKFYGKRTVFKDYAEGEKDDDEDKRTAIGVCRLIHTEVVVREVMIPRTDIVSIKNDATVRTLLTVIAESGHTKFPVYEENIDEILGIISLKDLACHFIEEGFLDEKIINYVRSPHFIPETKNIFRLFVENLKGTFEMSVVVDEHGGTSGLVTLVDIFKKIMEDINIYDSSARALQPASDGYFLIDGRSDVEVLTACFSLNLPEGRYETVGGFIFTILDRVPSAGEHITYENLRIIIDSSDGKRVKQIKVKEVEEMSE